MIRSAFFAAMFLVAFPCIAQDATPPLSRPVLTITIDQADLRDLCRTWIMSDNEIKFQVLGVRGSEDPSPQQMSFYYHLNRLCNKR
jgi:hypothetical protein